MFLSTLLNQSNQISNPFTQQLLQTFFQSSLSQSNECGSLVNLHIKEMTKEELKQTIKLKDDSEILEYLEQGVIKHHQLENLLNNTTRAVKIRRQYIEKDAIEQPSKVNPFQGKQDKNKPILTNNLPYEGYDYNQLYGSNCENVIGYVPIPIGVVGPFLINGNNYYIPLATTEGCLVASTQRGAKAISTGSKNPEIGVKVKVIENGMTRAPVLQCRDLDQCIELKTFIESNEEKIKQVFNSNSRFAKLKKIKIAINGNKIFLRFKAETGDAMGMNMVSKAATQTIKYLTELPQFKDEVEIVSVSGNFCIDKKPSAINWIEGRGKTVSAEVTIDKKVVEKVLKTSVDELVSLNISKNFIGSAMAGSIGGFNAHASNLVTAVFLATGNDCAQNVESSNCMTVLEKDENGDLYMSLFMPSIEVGTIGGGTHLKPQASCLGLMGGISGPNFNEPGKNSKTLSELVCATVMAGELSLMSSLCEGSLMIAHEKLNRKKKE